MTDYNTLQQRRNMIVGAFVLIGILALFWMVVIFGELPLVITRHKSFYVFAQFPEAPGIQKNTPVRYCGFQIGKVFRVDPPKHLVHLDTQKTVNQVKIGLAIKKEFEHQVPDTVQIRVMTRSMGSSYIAFIDTDEDPTGFINKDTTVMQGAIGSSTEFIPKEVQDKLERLVDNFIVVANDVHEVLGDEQNRQNVKKALEDFAKATEQADKTLKSIQEFSDTGSGALDTIVAELSETLKEVRVTINSINQGDGTIGKLVNDPALYENLIDITVELQMAIEQVEQFIVETRQKGVHVDLF